MSLQLADSRHRRPVPEVEKHDLAFQVGRIDLAFLVEPGGRLRANILDLGAGRHAEGKRTCWNLGVRLRLLNVQYVDGVKHTIDETGFGMDGGINDPLSVFYGASLPNILLPGGPFSLRYG